MSKELVTYCQTEIQYLLKKKLTRPTKSPWSCLAFYAYKASKIEREAPKLVINYKMLKKVLQWIKYPIPNKKDMLKRLYEAKVFS